MASPALIKRNFIPAADMLALQRAFVPDSRKRLRDISPATPESVFGVWSTSNMHTPHQDGVSPKSFTGGESIVPTSPPTADYTDTPTSEAKRLKPAPLVSADGDSASGVFVPEVLAQPTSVPVLRLVSQPFDFALAHEDIPAPVLIAVNQQYLTPGLFLRARLMTYEPISVALQGLSLVPVQDGIANFHKLRVILPNTAQQAQVAFQFTVCARLPDGMRELPGTSIYSRPFMVSATAQLPAVDYLTAAVKNGDGIALIETLRQPECSDMMRHCALHTAASSGQGAMVRLLLAAGVLTNTRDSDNDTALHVAALSGSIMVATHLLDAGADINAVNNIGFTPLHYAAAVQSVAMFELLVFRGASIKISAFGATAADLFPQGMVAVQAVITRKEEEVIAAIREGFIFGQQTHKAQQQEVPHSPSDSAASTTSSTDVSASTPAVAVAAASPPSPALASYSDDEEVDEDDLEEEPESSRRLNDERKKAAISAPLQLRIMSGIEPPLFKDSPLRMRLQIVANTILEGHQRALKKLMARLGGRARVTLHLEDAHGHPVREVAKGRRSGARIINMDEFDVSLAADGSFELANVRIREVSRNHAGGTFRLVVTVTGAPEVSVAVSRSFHVLSERIRAPSYRNQISRQRERRMRRAQASSV